MARTEVRPGTVLGRYVVEELLGEGAMGAVYRARDTQLLRPVALKVVRPGSEVSSADERRARQRLFREARAAAVLEHPSAVRIYDVGEIDDVAFIAMELVVGRPLRSFVGEVSVPMATRVSWLASIARALSAAHVRGLVHRDVKPDNVMIDADGHVKVLDFGIARRTPQAEVQGVTTLTQEGALLGTPRYMAPEQLRGERVDARADQFSWGVTAFELLAGAPPWSGDGTILALVARILSSPPPSLRAAALDVAPGLEAIVLRALSKAPDDRFPSMAALVAALDALPPISVPARSSSSPPLPSPTAAAPTKAAVKSGTRARGEQLVLTNIAFEIVDDLIIAFMNEKTPTDEEHVIIVDLMRRVPEGRVKRALNVTQGGGPTVMHRKAYNDALAGHELRTAVVSDKLSVRGIVTALSWYNSQIRAFRLAEMAKALDFLGIAPAEQPEVLATVEYLERQVGRAMRRQVPR